MISIKLITKSKFKIYYYKDFGIRLLNKIYNITEIKIKIERIRTMKTQHYKLKNNLHENTHSQFKQ